MILTTICPTCREDLINRATYATRTPSSAEFFQDEVCEFQPLYAERKEKSFGV